jgi:hypothetical protein
MWWTTFYLLGLHFSHIDFLPGMNIFVLKADIMATWSVELWIIFAVALVSIIAVFCLLVLFIFVSGYYILCIYIGWLFFLILVSTIMTFCFVNGIHIHHYTVGWLLLSLFGHHNFLIVALNGIFHGIFIEGCARWNMAPNWIIKREMLSDWVKDWSIWDYFFPKD